jgi:hypothetical protein
MVITSGAYGVDDGTKVKVGAADDDAKPDAGDARPAAGKPEGKD